MTKQENSMASGLSRREALHLAEWNGSLTPDYNAAEVREATIEYNEIKAKAKRVGS